MKKYLKRILFIITLLLLPLTLISCGNKTITYEIHTDLQKSYLEGDYKLIHTYAKGEEELSKPMPITITWKDTKDVKDYDFYLSEDSKFKEYRLYETTIAQVELINLKIHTKYYWYVEYTVNNKLVKTKVETFIINCHNPRNLDIDGLTNVRDIGGYKIGDKYTNQGLIYRSSRLNENESTTNLITEKGIKEMVEVLKIKSELDVRKTSDNENGGITVSPLGEGVNYYSVPMKSGGNYLLLNKYVLKDVFAVLGNKDNYPVVIHCSIGTDRTGVICFLINALLGVEEEYLYKDYLFSMFGHITVNRVPSTIDKYIELIKPSEGDTLKEKTYNYLLSLGVAETDLNNLIDIMTN